MVGDLTNRVALDKALTVQSINGPLVTMVKGEGAAIGPAAVRCAWLTNGAVLTGFTIRDGATRSAGDINTLQSGGGVWCSSYASTVANCIIMTNAGGAVNYGTVYNSFIRGNVGNTRGVTFSNLLVNCTIVTNSGSPGSAAGILT